jgi:hypothetical protein
MLFWYFEQLPCYVNVGLWCVSSFHFSFVNSCFLNFFLIYDQNFFQTLERTIGLVNISCWVPFQTIRGYDSESIAKVTMLYSLSSLQFCFVNSCFFNFLYTSNFFSYFFSILGQTLGPVNLSFQTLGDSWMDIRTSEYLLLSSSHLDMPYLESVFWDRSWIEV